MLCEALILGSTAGILLDMHVSLYLSIRKLVLCCIVAGELLIDGDVNNMEVSMTVSCFYVYL